MQKLIVAAAALTLFMFALVVYFGNAENQQKGYVQTQAAATAIAVEAASAQAEAKVAAARYEKWTGVLLAAGSCSPDHPVAKGIKTEAAYLASDAARYCREQAAAAASQAAEWRATAEALTEAQIYAESRAWLAGTAAKENAKSATWLKYSRYGALGAGVAFLILGLLSVIGAILERSSNHVFKSYHHYRW